MSKERIIILESNGYSFIVDTWHSDYKATNWRPQEIKYSHSFVQQHFMKQSNGKLDGCDEKTINRDVKRLNEDHAKIRVVASNGQLINLSRTNMRYIDVVNNDHVFIVDSHDLKAIEVLRSYSDIKKTDPFVKDWFDISDCTMNTANAKIIRGKIDKYNALEDKFQKPNNNYYGGENNPYEAIKVIHAHNLGFDLGNVIKYVLRAGKKDPEKEIEDLEKAKNYIDYRIKELKK